MVLKKMGLEEEMEKKRWGFFFFFRDRVIDDIKLLCRVLERINNAKHF